MNTPTHFKTEQTTRDDLAERLMEFCYQAPYAIEFNSHFQHGDLAFDVQRRVMYVALDFAPGQPDEEFTLHFAQLHEELWGARPVFIFSEIAPNWAGRGGKVFNSEESTHA